MDQPENMAVVRLFLAGGNRCRIRETRLALAPAEPGNELAHDARTHRIRGGEREKVVLCVDVFQRWFCYRILPPAVRLARLEASGCRF